MLTSALLGPLLALLNGPIFSIVDKLIPDPNLKAKLKAEMTSQVMQARKEFASAQRDIVLAEISQGSLLARSWRPILMYLVMTFLLVYGLVLPTLDLLLVTPMPFKPRWHDIPEGMWNLLSIGVGGYIGGRTIEKVSTTVARRVPVDFLRKSVDFKRKNNLYKGPR